ncbi:MAG: divergent polysaccharide deacetylase family protein, partial [Pseudomonadota bacterium]|nr:divergent polysaccharide deacetylase family protein [Pseudomonadota bacterium]
PHTLLTGLPPEENIKRLQWLMGRFTGYTGITNHMGAKFVAAQQSFLPVLEELHRRGLIYLDDGTAGRSTAGTIARDLGLGFATAQLSIDAEPSPERIDAALDRLAGIAREQGFAIGIGTALPATIDHVAEWATQLKSKGVMLVPVSAVVRSQHQS